jgi:hypothetical protein
MNLQKTSVFPTYHVIEAKNIEAKKRMLRTTNKLGQGKEERQYLKEIIIKLLI